MRDAVQPGAGMAGSSLMNLSWTNFEAWVSELTGIFVQAVDARGRPFGDRGAVPPLCAFLERSPLAGAACRRDCHLEIGAHADPRRTVPGRCYAGLNYRIVPAGTRGEEQVYLVVGRVLTEIFGGEQISGFPEKYRLDRTELLEALMATRALPSPELDRVAAYARRIAKFYSLSRRRLEGRRRRIGACREHSRRVEREAEAIRELAARIIKATDVEEILGLALETAMACLRARRGSILLAEESRAKVTAQVFRGEHAGVAPTVTELQPDSVSLRVYAGCRPLLVRDAERELGRHGDGRYPYATRSFLSVPLCGEDRPLGVLHVTEGDGVFTAEDLVFLERLGVQASTAIRKRRLEDELAELRVRSETDPLTGARNRRFLEEHLAGEFERASRFGQPLAGVMIDIDGFKGLNDRLGHECGDRVLRDLVAAIRRQVRAIDVLTRYGGDEFLLLLPGTDLGGALNTAEKIRAAAEALPVPGPRPGAPARLTVSCGVAAFPLSASSPERLLLEADRALLEAKRGGKNRVVIA